MTTTPPGPALPGPVPPDPGSAPPASGAAPPEPRPVPPDPAALQLAQDRQHLDLLSIFHYVLGAMAGLFACFPIFHVVMGLGMATGFGGPVSPADEVPLRLFGLMFAGLGTGIILLGWIFAVLVAINGLFLARRQRYRYCLVVGALECFFTPFGTVLGILTLIVLARPSVKALFDAPGAPH